MKRTMALLGMAAILFAGGTHAAEIQSTGNGNWTNTATWVGGVVPTLADRVLIKFDDTVTVDSAGNEAGSFRLDSGKAYLNLDAGGSLAIVNSGAYPTNGTVTFKSSGTPAAINIQGGDFTAQGSFTLSGGDTGVTNALNVTDGSVDLSAFVSIGDSGAAGVSEVAISGSNATFQVSGNMTVGSNAVMRWTAEADGAVTPIESDVAGKTVTLDGDLIVDLTALTVNPGEIILIDNAGSDAISGTFASTTLTGSSDYQVSYTGGDGNDLSLIYTGYLEFESVGDGNWTNTATWNQQRLPMATDRVLLKFQDDITVDSTGNQAGSLKLDASEAYLNVDSGGALTIVNSGAFPTNGVVDYKQASSASAINVQGGDFTVEGTFTMDGGGAAGVTNALNVTDGSVDLSAFTAIGNGSALGLAEVAITGSDATFLVGGNLKLGANGILSWTTTADGSVTPIVLDSNSKQFKPQGEGALVVDMTAMTARPDEILLVDNYGSDAIDGVFAATNLIGNTDYAVSYVGGDGNDLVLSNVAPLSASSQLIAGWTKKGTGTVFPSEKHPGDNGLKVRIESTASASKADRGSSDMTYGSGLYTNSADEASFHSSTNTFGLKVGEALTIIVSNAYGLSGLNLQLDYVMTDWTAPFGASPKTIDIKYIEGDLGIPTNTLLATDSMATSGQTGFQDYADVDAPLLGYTTADRTLNAREYAMFEITVSTNTSGNTGATYVDNIGVGATVTTNAPTYAAFSNWFGLVEGELGDDDGDGLRNISEYGLGGDPTNSTDVGFASTAAIVEDSGTNYLEYVYPRRIPTTLTYSVVQNDDLVSGSWTNTGEAVEIGSGIFRYGFEYVTNRVPTTGKSVEFIGVNIQ